MTDEDKHVHKPRTFRDGHGTHVKCEECGLILSRSMLCPKCGVELPRIDTAYGERATCERDSIRWTRLHSENDWRPEPFSPMSDHLK